MSHPLHGIFIASEATRPPKLNERRRKQSNQLSAPSL
jgi:hypothetical protein